MNQAAAVGTVQDVEVKNLGSLGDYVTVWGEYVPQGFQPGVLLTLTEAGYIVRSVGHTIQVRLDKDDFEVVDSVRKLIREYKGEGW